jgi:hypothetical protein
MKMRMIAIIWGWIKKIFKFSLMISISLLSIYGYWIYLHPRYFPCQFNQAEKLAYLEESRQKQKNLQTLTDETLTKLEAIKEQKLALTLLNDLYIQLQSLKTLKFKNKKINVDQLIICLDKDIELQKTKMMQDAETATGKAKNIYMESLKSLDEKNAKFKSYKQSQSTFIKDIEKFEENLKSYISMLEKNQDIVFDALKNELVKDLEELKKQSFENHKEEDHVF